MDGLLDEKSSPFVTVPIGLLLVGPKDTRGVAVAMLVWFGDMLRRVANSIVGISNIYRNARLVR